MIGIKSLFAKGSSIGRMEYFIVGVLIPLIIVGLGFIINQIVFMIAFASIIHIYFSVKRARDTKYRTALLIIGLFLPYISIIFYLILLFAPHGEKKFGTASKLLMNILIAFFVITFTTMIVIAISKFNEVSDAAQAGKERAQVAEKIRREEFKVPTEERLTCSNTIVQEIVQELSEDQIINRIIFNEIYVKKMQNNKDMGSTVDNLYLGNILLDYETNGIAQIMIESQKNSEGSEVNQLYIKLKKDYQTNLMFNMANFRTVNKNKELQKIECIAILESKVGQYSFKANVGYKAQLTDDGEQVYVELLSFSEQ